jgi:glycosyltransferase involved in cell wall biosynthesis
MSGEEKKYANIFKWMEDTIQHADAVVAVSKNLKQEILEGYPVKEKKVYYIPNGVDLSLFKPNNSIAEQKKILYVGRFSPEKGIDLLPRIINTVLYHDKELSFEIVAPNNKLPPSMDKVVEKFELLEKKYPKRFIWQKEILGREELAKKYNESMLLVQPSLYESFGMNVLEAMACGKAVIVSNKGALSEVAGDGGVVVPLSTKAFSRAILKLSKDYKLRQRYARRGIERAKTFAWEDIAKQILELYMVITKKTNEENGNEKPHEKVHEGLQNLEKLQEKDQEELPKNIQKKPNN